ncbi:hypothetical protein [Legionella taurinensis]|uniref:Uncharacterized protein n=1 Tax=Legionella taurinensis TaxID=70611 RepID=A0A3A5LFD0_9GAMM|nr:hypothetical protein [Legionella taurinensis]RJT48211.1 hypothetical protein D6J04_03690 [Legionella taurinensis]RJT69125.1 hypothetical protein D6J03_03525 [Legionella taurinensis]STY25952.1 Ran GTPase-activating protein (RanGAP) involved in mRNA processing and transport [Legionella taurinensis]
MKPFLSTLIKSIQAGKFPANGIIDCSKQKLNDEDLQILATALRSSANGQTITYNLSGNQFSIQGIQALWLALSKASFSSPVVIDLTSTQLGDGAIASLANHLKHFPSSITLKIGKNAFRSLAPLASAVASGKCPKDFTLDLTGSPVSLTTVTELKTVLSKAPDNLTLNLSSTPLKDEGAIKLFEALESPNYPKKQTIVLRFTGLTAQSSRAMTKSLEKLNSQHQLSIDLEGNRLASDGLHAFSTLLAKPNSPLLKLNVKDNDINSLGIEALSKALSSGNVLPGTCIDLSKNLLDDDALKTLWEALQSKKCPANLTLILNQNSLGKKTLSTLAQIADQLPNGLRISLVGNKFSKEDLAGFIEGIQGRLLPFSLHLDIGAKDYPEEQQKIDGLCQLPLQTVVNFLVILQGQAQESSPLSVFSDEIIRHIFSFVATVDNPAKIARLHDKASDKLRKIYTSDKHPSNEFFTAVPKALEDKDKKNKDQEEKSLSMEGKTKPH